MKNQALQDSTSCFPIVSIALLSALYGIWLYFWQPVETIYHYDSPGLINFSPLHPAGYPWLLDLLEGLTGTVETVIILQIVAAATAIGLLTYAVLIRFQSRAYAALVFFALVCNPFLAKVHCWIATDSLFASTVMAVMAGLILLDHSFTKGKILFLGILIPLTVAMRPLALSLYPLWIFVFWLYWSQIKSMNWKTVLCLIVLPCIVITLVERTYYTSIHDTGSDQQLINHHLFAKGVMVNAAIDEEIYNSGFVQAVKDFREKTAAELSQKPDMLSRLYYLRNREVEAQHRFDQGVIDQAASDLQMNDQEFRKYFGLETLKANPLGYMRLVLRHYIGSWTIYTNTNILPEQMPVWDASFIGLARIAIFLTSLITLFCAVSGLLALLLNKKSVFNPFTRLIFLSSLYIHGYFLLIALAGVFVSRYTVDIWGAMVVSMGLLAFYCLEVLKSRLSHKNAGP